MFGVYFSKKTPVSDRLNILLATGNSHPILSAFHFYPSKRTNLAPSQYSNIHSFYISRDPWFFYQHIESSSSSRSRRHTRRTIRPGRRSRIYKKYGSLPCLFLKVGEGCERKTGTNWCACHGLEGAEAIKQGKIEMRWMIFFITTSTFLLLLLIISTYYLLSVRWNSFLKCRIE